MRIPSPQQYSQMVKKATPKSPTFKNCSIAFLVGGSICTLGEILKKFYIFIGADKDSAAAFVSISLILLSAILTSLGVYDKIAKHAGAGTLVAITGFANSMVSPAMEFHSEGLVLGVGTKIFSISGPVILYGTAAGVLYGWVYWIIKGLRV